jgi:hypothetical protein
MAQLKISKVTSLPGTFDPSTLYLVSDAVRTDDVNIYVSNSAGTAVKHVPTFAELETMVDTKIAAGISAASALRVVADITARNALNPTVTTLALVLDATDDISVTSGAATYVFTNNGEDPWTKITEYESLDVAIQWDNILYKPASTVTDIDDAVTKRHTHTNKAVLDLLTFTTVLEYNGQPVVPQLVAEQW